MPRGTSEEDETTHGAGAAYQPESKRGARGESKAKGAGGVGIEAEASR